MANTAVTGFIPSRVIGGGPITYRTRMRVLTNNTTAIFLYDALKVTSAGDYLVASATNTAVASVSAGVTYIDTAGVRREAKYLPAATLYTSSGVQPYNATYLTVVDNEVQTEFRCSFTTVLTQTNDNNTFQMVLGAGSTVTGLSGHTLDSASVGTTSTFPWRVKDFIRDSSETDPDLANAHVYAQINRSLTEPALSDGTGT